MREHFFIRFGAGQPEVFKERERIYLEGMPDSSGVAFPPRCNIEDKLDALEAEREYLLDMCPNGKRATYEEGKESTLVRIILRTISGEYDAAVKSMHDMVRFRKANATGLLGSITNLPDHSRKNYSEEWLPPYEELRAELINALYLLERRRKEAGKTARKGAVSTLPILNGHEQPGPNQKRCFNCGQTGHIGTDPVCKARSTEVWKGASASYQLRRQGGAKSGGEGRGKGGEANDPKQRNSNKRKAEKDFTKIPCHNWSRGNGFCKYDGNCRYSHDGPKGDKNKGHGDYPKKSSLPMTKNLKKEKKSSLLLADMSDGYREEESSAEKGHLYELIRGVPTVVIKTQERTGSYIPVDTGFTGLASNVVVKLRPEPRFVVTLPILNAKSKPGRDYKPKDKTARGKIFLGKEIMGKKDSTFLVNEPMGKKDSYLDVLKRKNQTPGNRREENRVY